MTITIEEVANHNTKDDCWIIIHGKVYDVTNFLGKHPGGANIIFKLAGKDGSTQFDKFHGLNILTSYLFEKVIVEKGDIGGAAAEEAAALAKLNAEKEAEQQEVLINKYEPERVKALLHKPHLDEIMNLYDFEFVANKTLEPVARNYYSSGVDDEITCRENHFAYKRIFFNPRVLIDVTECDLSTTLFGSKTSAPFYVTSTAMQKYAHPMGEKVFSRGCKREDIIQMIPCLSSFSFEEIRAGIDDSTPFWYQLYPSAHEKLNETILKKVAASGCKGFFVTVDNVYGGNREKDKRIKEVMSKLIEKEKANVSEKEIDRLRLVSAAKTEEEEQNKNDPSSLGRRAVTWITWDNMRHMKKLSNMPFIIKGIQTVEDAELAVKYGMDGIVISNHGGRQADYAKSTIEVLYDLNQKGITKQIDVFIDGGVRRGTDILKALSLGAKAVGIGRGLLYPVATYGEEGLVKAIQILKQEMITTMRNIGITKLSELNENAVDTTNIKNRISNSSDPFDLYNRSSLPVLFPNFDKIKL